MEVKDFKNMVGKHYTSFLGTLGSQFQVEILPIGAQCIQNFVENRLRIFVDDDGIIIQEPREG